MTPTRTKMTRRTHAESAAVSAMFARVRRMLLAIFLIAPLVAAADDSLSAYVDAAATRLPAQAQEVLPSIDGEPRRVLAMRAYLRAGDSFAKRWSWTNREIAEYERSEAHRRLLGEIGKVQARFEAQNPGYSLFANTEVRSLDLQLSRWNENRGVAEAAERVYAMAGDELRHGDYPATPDAKATQRFVTFLRNLPAPMPVPLAAPGMSLHGQLRAMDFQVRKNGRTVAGPEVASVSDVWEKQGWARKLHAAIDPALGAFAGPLRVPNEPWHYEYVR